FGVEPWIPALVAVVFFALVNFGAVRGFGEFEFWFAIIKVAVIVAFLVLGAWLIFGPAETQSTSFVENIATNGVPGLAACLLAVAFACGVIELVTIAAAESEIPAHNVATAVRAIIVRIIIFYLGSVAVITLLLPFSNIKDADVAAQSPFTEELRVAEIPYAATFMELVIVVALLSAFNAQIYATSRLVFDMARDNNAPGLFKFTSKSGSPLYAVILSMIFAFASVGLQYWNPPGLLAF